MNRRIEHSRWNGIERAKELIKLADTRPLTDGEVEELKQSHTGYGGITWGDNTQFFTPQVVTDFMVDMIDIPNGANVLEFSCGAGAFINALYKKNKDISVTGIELSSELAKLASVCYPEANIIRGDALEYMDKFKNSMDLIIGNPPFGKGPKTIDGFQYAKGKLEEYFLELAVNCLKEGGEAILIMPDGVLANSQSAKIRKWVLEECYYMGTISLPPETFYFSGTSCKTSVIFFKKKYKEVEVEDYSVFMAIANEIGWNSRGQMTGKCDLDEIKTAYRENIYKMQKGLFVPRHQLKEVVNL